ncbi:hypothetical protein O6H91_03G016100 [Diphasiastrum complanatum]|uniref:Uncharacterized protein n=1 Tax=Diphasiastrum complanatum TaxID=34168 RepID=A0ACC2E3P6_DIPCM|nr:hypothetical protein O6H91_03G016100 [Diphasiastrum complanatum]
MGTVNMNHLLDTSPGGRPEACHLANQHPIYSLMLDEFQNSLGETGKNCGSMNMEEFLKTVMTAEETQAGSDFARDGLARQASLLRQGFLTLPRTLSRKTVHEFWKDVYQGPAAGAASAMDCNGNESAAGHQQKQTSFGEMTLQDFLVKAGVVRDNIASENQSSSVYGGGPRDIYDFGLAKMGTTDSCDEKVRVQHAASEIKEFVNSQTRVERGSARVGSSLTLSPASVLSSQPAMDVNQSVCYQNVVSPEWFNPQYRDTTIASVTHQQQQQMAAGTAAYFDVAKRVSNAGGAVGVGMGEIRAGNSFGGGLACATGALGHLVPGQNVCIGFGTAAGRGGMDVLALGSVSPISPDSDGGAHYHPYGFGLPALANYRIDGPVQGRKMESEMRVQKVVERRQRRMIKNRESAARSRARKQAYTTELELEVRQLKEVNRKLRRQQEDGAEKKKKMKLELMTSPFIWRSSPMPKQLRRTATGPW